MQSRDLRCIQFAILFKANYKTIIAIKMRLYTPLKNPCRFI